MSEYKMKPIWYFVGMILLAMGGIIFLYGIYSLINPPEVKKVLADMHPDIWWGLVMILFGGFMFWKSRKQSV